MTLCNSGLFSILEKPFQWLLLHPRLKLGNINVERVSWHVNVRFHGVLSAVSILST